MPCRFHPFDGEADVIAEGVADAFVEGVAQDFAGVGNQFGAELHLPPGQTGQQLLEPLQIGLVGDGEDLLHLVLADGLSGFASKAQTAAHEDVLPAVGVETADNVVVDGLQDLEFQSRSPPNLLRRKKKTRPRPG